MILQLLSNIIDQMAESISHKILHRDVYSAFIYNCEILESK